MQHWKRTKRFFQQLFTYPSPVDNIKGIIIEEAHAPFWYFGNGDLPISLLPLFRPVYHPPFLPSLYTPYQVHNRTRLKCVVHSRVLTNQTTHCISCSDVFVTHLLFPYHAPKVVDSFEKGRLGYDKVFGGILAVDIAPVEVVTVVQFHTAMVNWNTFCTRRVDDDLEHRIGNKKPVIRRCLHFNFTYTVLYSCSGSCDHFQSCCHDRRSVLQPLSSLSQRTPVPVLIQPPTGRISNRNTDCKQISGTWNDNSADRWTFPFLTAQSPMITLVTLDIKLQNLA